MEWFLTTVGCIVLYVLFKFTPAKVEAALLQRQRETIKRLDDQINQLFDAWEKVIRFKKFELSVKLAADGKVKLVARHEDPVLQAEAQAEVDELQKLLDEIRTGKEKRERMN